MWRINMENVINFCLSEINKIICESECIMYDYQPMYECVCIVCVRVCESVCCHLKLMLYGKQNEI